MYPMGNTAARREAATNYELARLRRLSGQPRHRM